MHPPGPFTLQPLGRPPERPVVTRAVLPGVTGLSSHYTTGQVVNARLAYPDLFSFAWWWALRIDDRFRSSIQETAGEILRGVSAVDVSANEAFPVRNIPIGGYLHFHAATERERPTHLFEVAKRLQEEHTDSYQYATLLGRLSRHYPAQILVSAQSVTGRATMTAREALQYVLERWQEQAPWLVWAELPEFLISTSDGLLNLETQALALLQDEARPRSMRDILDEFLSIFVAYVLRANSAGEIEFVPPPWVAQEMPYVIEPQDVYDLSRLGEIDYTDIVNRASVRVRRWEFQAGHEVMQPASIGVTGGNPLTEGHDPKWEGSPDGELWLGNADIYTATQYTWPAVPDVLLGTAEIVLDMDIESRVEYRGTSRRGVTDPAIVWSSQYQQVQLTAAAAEGATELETHPLEYPLATGRRILFGDVAAVVASDATANAASVTVQPLSVAQPLGAVGDTSRAHVTLDGGNRRVANTKWHFQVHGLTTDPTGVDVWMEGHSNGEILVSFRPGEWGFDGGYGAGGQVRAAFRIVMRGLGQSWQQSRTSEAATFGREDDDAVVAGLLRSQSEFGILEKTLNASFFSPTLDQAMQIAQAYVRANMWPVERFQVEQGPAMPVFPDDINRLVRLPNDAEGTVESWEYADQFAFDSVAWSSGFVIARHLMPDPADSTIEQVIVTPPELMIYAGGQRILQLTVIGEGVYSHGVTWESSDPTIATVNPYGAVNALLPGVVTITATSTQDTSKSGSAEITVTEDSDPDD